MADTIKDGTGSGLLAGVNTDNRLKTQARTLTNAACLSWAELTGNAYMIATTPRAMGTGYDQILYIKNNSDNRNLVFQFIEQHYGGGGGGATPIYWKIERNPTAPTTGTSVITPLNTNFGSNKTANVTVLQWDGTTGTGMTGGSAGSTLYEAIVTASHGHTFEEIICLPAQATIALYWKAATGGGIANFVIHFTLEQ